MTDMRLHGDGHSNIRCIDSLLPFSNYPDLYRETFDLVMTNPPFGVDLPQDSVSQLGPFELVTERRSTVSLEIVALERCSSAARPAAASPSFCPMAYSAIAALQPCATGSGDRLVSVPSSACPRDVLPFGASIKTSILVLARARRNRRR